MAFYSIALWPSLSQEKDLGILFIPGIGTFKVRVFSQIRGHRCKDSHRQAYLASRPGMGLRFYPITSLAGISGHFGVKEFGKEYTTGYLDLPERHH